jgi:beta-galactosidase/beta-glucuronidase
MTNNEAHRQDYPRPQFVREPWVNLNGEWEFDFDDSNVGVKQKWYERSAAFSKKIQVPFCFQSPLSGIGETDFHEVVWYRKSFAVPDVFAAKEVILHFGAVDYQAWVWVNGQFVMVHEGGHVPFQLNITNALRDGENTLVVKAKDFGTDCTIPRGKQYWKEKSEGIFYTRTTGIWQTVWIEVVNQVHLSKVKLTPDIDTGEIEIESFINGDFDGSDVRLKAQISFSGEAVTEELFQINARVEKRSVKLPNINFRRKLNRLWSPENPNLFYISFTLLVDGKEVDHVQSYFGMRKISVLDGKLHLNNFPYYMKMVLDQGYFPDGILTPPSDEAVRRDVELTKEMGFNGARKHQKVEDPRYLYWCDRLGLLVWGEMANAYDYSGEYVRRITNEWQAAVERDFNHPCIVAWVPINESWGVSNILVDKLQQAHAYTMYYLTKSLDPTRLVISNDGWEHIKSDLCTIHDYLWRKDILEKRYGTVESALQAMPARRKIYVGDGEYRGEPILVTEFGGISYKKSDWEGWGYSAAENEEDFLQRLGDVIAPLLNSSVVQGYCYTQLTDVEQEINGLLTYDRKPKVPLEQIRALNEGTAGR